MFRRKKTDDEILHCPLCSLENPLDADTCTRCYYDFTVSSHQQSRKSDDQVVGGLLDELTSGIEEGEEDQNDVDWTNHSFDMSDFSVDVAEYDDSDDVVVSHSIGFARQLVSDDEIGGDVEDNEFVLSSDDAPKSVEKFIVPEEEESEISIPEPTLIKLVDPTSNSTNEMDSDLMNEDWNVTDSAPILNSEDRDVNPVSIAPAVQASNVQEPPHSSALPQMPSMPQSEQPSINVETPLSPKPSTPVSAPPAAVFQHENSVSETAPKMPVMPVMPSMPVEQTSQPELIPREENNSIWPWSQSDPWDDRILASKIKEAMEAAKSDRKDDASRILDEIGPHLSDKYRLMLYVGALLKNLGRTNELASMLNAAKISKSEDQHVAAALKQLG